MHDDELMDRLLKESLAADAPQLSRAFDAGVMQRIRPHRLTSLGRMVIAVYTVVATASAVWLMQDVSLTALAVAVAISVPVAAGASAYGRAIALRA